MVVQHRPLTPAQVLSWLPRDATPAQQDSAIQAHFKPSEIHWSEHPDTLHLPGHSPGVDLMKADLPQYYKESFFSKSALSILNCLVGAMVSPATQYLILSATIISSPHCC